VTVLLLVNGGYQSIHALQRATTASSLGTEFPELDYAANARTFGWQAWEVESAGELAGALERGARRDRPRDRRRARRSPARAAVRRRVLGPRRRGGSRRGPRRRLPPPKHARGRAAQRHYGWVAP